MEALILSCSTGGGHNSAARAIKEELERRGHGAVIRDPYALARDKLADGVGSAYVKSAQNFPKAFGAVYSLGNFVRRMPFRSPVYWVNTKMARYLESYLNANSFDVIVMTHLFPAEILTHMKKQGFPLPPTVFVATDYTCVPFTEETDCDYYVIPSEKLATEFRIRGIAAEKLLPYGIPVSSRFNTDETPAEAKSKMGLSADGRYILISGGSIGAGKLEDAVEELAKYSQTEENLGLIAICGNNARVYNKLYARYKNNKKIRILKSTKHMADYMRAADVFVSKPGGLSSTEAAVLGVPLVHMTPIPGCETINMSFFSQNGMSIAVGDDEERLIPAVIAARDAALSKRMVENQRAVINGRAVVKIFELLEKLSIKLS